MATNLIQFDDGLACELIDHVEGPRTIGCTCIVAQIDIVVLGQLLADALKNGQSAIAGIEDSDRSGSLWESLSDRVWKDKREGKGAGRAYFFPLNSCLSRSVISSPCALSA